MDSKDAVMKMLLSSPTKAKSTVESFKMERIGVVKREDSGTRLSEYLHQLNGQVEGSLSVVELDHCYSKPWNWRPEHSHAKPVKTLFINRPQNTINSTDKLDPVEESPDPVPVYDTKKAKVLMEECQKHISLVRADPGEVDWESKVNRQGWTSTQCRLFDRVCRILHQDYLARCSYKGSWNEPITLRICVDKSARRLRSILGTYGWQPKLIQWLHSLLMECLDVTYLSAYIDILQALNAKVPKLVERMFVNFSNPSINTDALNVLLKRPWDPVSVGLTSYNPMKLPNNPLLVMVPSTLSHSGGCNQRFQRWQNYLSQLGTTVIVNTVINCGSNKVTVMSSLELIISTTRAKVAELKAENPGRPVVLVGLNTAAGVACQVALLEPVAAIICLGFPLNTVEDKRGQPDDSLLNLTVPLLFIVGQHAATSSIDDLEELRERLRVETGLVVVGSADDQLRICKAKQLSEGITQSMVDRCVVDEISDFVGTVLSTASHKVENRQRLRIVERKRKISGMEEGLAKKSSLPGVRRQKMTGQKIIGKPKWTAHVQKVGDLKIRGQYKGNGVEQSGIIKKSHFMNHDQRISGDTMKTVVSLNGDTGSEGRQLQLVPQIKVLGSKDAFNLPTSGDNSFVDQLTPDRLLEMPVIIAQEDSTNEPAAIKVLVSGEGGVTTTTGKEGGSIVKYINDHQLKSATIYLRRKEGGDSSNQRLPTVSIGPKPLLDAKGIRNFPATQHVSSTPQFIPLI